MKFPLTNIYNRKSLIYLFGRQPNGDLIIKKIHDFLPYYYEPDKKGEFVGYDGTLLKKITVNEPSEVKELRSDESFESDILYPKRYIIDKIDQFDKCPIKFCFLDIETYKPEDDFPMANSAKYPVTSITIYNSKYNKVRNWFINDYGSDLKKAEEKLFYEFVTYFRKAKFDLILGWFLTSFDFPYLSNRFSKLPQEIFFEKESKYNNFATAISPIQMVRGGSREYGEFYPAGTSVVDFLEWFKRIYKNEKSYNLNDIMEKYLGVGKEFKNVDFSKINEIIRKRNICDVQGLVDLEKKFKLIPLYDEIRRTALVGWEDFIYLMRIIDNLMLKEAKKRNVVLPSVLEEKEKEEFEGAYREVFQTGDFYNASKYDLSSCYPSIIRDLCLDTENISLENKDNLLPVSIRDRETNEVKEIHYVKQNPNALLPTVVGKLLEQKNKFKKLKKETNPELPEYENIDLQYEAIKVISNACFGITGNRFYRLYDPRISSLITSNARDLLHYLKDKVKEMNFEVLYTDTDGLIIDDRGEDLSNKLNNLIQEWSKDRFNKSSSIVIDKEGTFEKIFILTMCRYLGFLKTSKGLKREEKGLQIKRKDSTAFIAEFQEALLNKIWDKQPLEKIIEFVKLEMERIKTLPIIEISFPARLGKKMDDYKTQVTNKSGTTYDKKPPIFVQAYQNTHKLNPKWRKGLGELFMWIYVYNKDKEIIPMAFDEQTQSMIKDVCWEKQIERNITNIISSIFEAKHWENPFVPQKIKRVKKDPITQSQPTYTESDFLGESGDKKIEVYYSE